MKTTEHMTKLFKALYDYGYRYLRHMGVPPCCTESKTSQHRTKSQAGTTSLKKINAYVQECMDIQLFQEDKRNLFTFVLYAKKSSAL